MKNEKRIVVNIPCQLSKEDIDKKMWNVKSKVADALNVCHECGKKIRYKETYCQECLYPYKCNICGTKAGKFDKIAGYHVCGSCKGKKPLFVNEDILVVTCVRCASTSTFNFKELDMKYDSEQRMGVATEITAMVKKYIKLLKCKTCNKKLTIEEVIEQTSYGKPRIRCKEGIVIVSPKLKRKPESDTTWGPCYLTIKYTGDAKLET